MPRKKVHCQVQNKDCLIYSEDGLNPNMAWKQKPDFLQNTPIVFGADTERKAVQRKDDDLKKKNARCLRPSVS